VPAQQIHIFRLHGHADRQTWPSNGASLAAVQRRRFVDSGVRLRHRPGDTFAGRVDGSPVFFLGGGGSGWTATYLLVCLSVPQGPCSNDSISETVWVLEPVQHPVAANLQPLQGKGGITQDFPPAPIPEPFTASNVVRRRVSQRLPGACSAPLPVSALVTRETGSAFVL
jgi:hypothetical protein